MSDVLVLMRYNRNELCKLPGLGLVHRVARCVLEFGCAIGVNDFARCEVGQPEPELFVGGGMGEGDCLRKASPLQCELCVFLGEWI